MKTGLFLFISICSIAFGLLGCLSQAARSIDKPIDAVDENSFKQDSAISQTVAKLREIKTKNDPIEDAVKIPADAKTLLPTLKRQLTNLIQQTLDSQNNARIDSQILQAQILEQLKNDRIEVGEPEETVIDENYVEPEFFQGFGKIYEIDVRRPAEHDDLIAVTTELSIPYGIDASLYIFRNKDNRWKLILAHESNNYDEISDARSQFGYSISPPDKQNKFFVATANFFPWFVGCWQSLRYTVMREGQTADQPQVIARKKHFAYRCHEPPYFLATTANEFTISFDGGESMDKMNDGIEIDFDNANRIRTEKYKVNGQQVKLVSTVIAQ